MTTSDRHRWNEYFDTVDTALGLLGDRLYAADASSERSDHARSWWLGFLLRAQRLLVDASLVARSSPTGDGVIPLSRTAYESAMYAMWVRADSSRASELANDLVRVHASRMMDFAEEWKPVAEATRSMRLPSFEQIVIQAARWAGSTTPVAAHRMTREADGSVVSERIGDDGEPYASSYKNVYRLLSGLAMHGPALASGVLHLGTGQLARGKSEPDPRDVLVLVTELTMASASRCFGWGILSPPTDLGDPSRLEWEAAHMRLRMAAGAVADDEPDRWAHP